MGSPYNIFDNKYKTFSVLIYSYINMSGNWENEKLCGNTTLEGRSVFTQFFKTKSKVSNIPGKVSMEENDNERLHADNNTDIANMFNEYFASIFTSDSDSNSERQDHSQVITIDNIALLEEEVMAVIMNLDSNKAQGPDNIPVRLLKETAMQITYPITLCTI